MTVPVMMIVALAIGLAIGALAGSRFSPAVAQAKKLREELERLRQEHDGYRASVNSHFRKTADLVGQMTKSYAAVYDHLAGGARRFCDGEAGDGELSFSPLPGSLVAPVIETNDDASREAPAAGTEDVAAEDAAIVDRAEAAEAAGDYADASLQDLDASTEGTGEAFDESAVAAPEPGPEAEQTASKTA